MIERALLCMRAQSHPTLCDPMDYIACRAPSSIEFSQQEYWSGLPFPSPGIEPSSLASPALADGFFTVEPPGGGGQRKDLGGGAGSGEGQADGGDDWVLPLHGRDARGEPQQREARAGAPAGQEQLGPLLTPSMLLLAGGSG